MPHFGEPTPEGPGKRRFCRITTGTYQGTGAATQSIIGVGFPPKVVIIRRRESWAQNYGIKTDQDVPQRASYIDMAALMVRYENDMIISLDPDGFTVGDGTAIGNVFNAGGAWYTYTCLG